MKGKLSTHVLDNYFGKPAAGIAWKLYLREESGAWTLLREGETNDDGRTDSPLLIGATMPTGCYQLNFEVGAFYRSKDLEITEPAFLDTVVIQVNLTAGENYHVPLLMTPWSYSTYRGS